MSKNKLGLGKLFCISTVILLIINVFASSFIFIESKSEAKSEYIKATKQINLSLITDSDSNDLLFEEEFLEELLEEDFDHVSNFDFSFFYFRSNILEKLSSSQKFKYHFLAVNSVPKWLLIRHILI